MLTENLHNRHSTGLGDRVIKIVSLYCGRLSNDLQRALVLSHGACDYVTFQGTCDEVKELELRRWCQPVWVGSECSHKCSYKEKAAGGGGRGLREEGGGNVMMEAGVEKMMWSRAWSKERGQPPEGEKAMGTILPRTSRGSTSLSTPWWQPSDTDGWRLISRPVGKRISVVTTVFVVYSHKKQRRCLPQSL